MYLYRRLGGEHSDVRISAEEKFLESVTDSQVKAAIEAIPDSFRMAVLLADVEGFAYKEIAEILEVPIGTVMSRIHRGRKALEKQLHEYARDRNLLPSGSEQDELAADGEVVAP